MSTFQFIISTPDGGLRGEVIEAETVDQAVVFLRKLYQNGPWKHATIEEKR